MAFTNKIANIVKNNVSNLTGNLTNTIGNVTSNVKSAFGQPEKIAAKLASKSPLDVSHNPVAHMEDQYNPFNYGQLYYPEETSNLGEGHYVVFDIIMNDKSQFKTKTFNNQGKLVDSPSENSLVGELKRAKLDKRLANYRKQGFVNQKADSIVRKQTSGFNSQNPTHTFLSDSITLYTPPSVKFQYQASYEEAETAMIGDFLELKKNFSFGGTLSFGKKILEKMALSAAEVVIPGVQGAVSKITGVSMNPQMELAFKSVPFRTFNFPFEFAPKNPKELETVHKIINLFKFHMMPEKYKVGYLATPSEFQITYYYRDNANMYIPKISRCALQNMEVDYTPNNVFSTFKADDRGAAPVITKVNLEFKEMEIMTKETIAEGH